MKKNILLATLLIIQGVLAFLLLSGGSKLNRHAGIQTLLEFNRELLDGIRIEDNEGNVAELNAVDGIWLTADQFPVDASQVDRLLGRLNGLQHGLAVARSASAAKRFEVSDSQYQRHLQLFQEGSPVVDLYLGSGAGARRSYVRLAEQAAIYTATIGGYDLSADISDWQDKELLQLEIDAIKLVQIADWRIRKSPSDAKVNDDVLESGNALRGESAWIAEGLLDGETFKAEDFAVQLRNLATLRYNRGIAGLLEGACVLEAEIVVNYANMCRRYQFYKRADRDEFWLKVSDREEFFEVSAYIAKPIIEALTKDKLIEMPEPDLEAADIDASESEKSD